MEGEMKADFDKIEGRFRQYVGEVAGFEKNKKSGYNN